MLPDLPRMKKDIAELFQIIFKNRLNAYLGVVGEVPRYIIKEGANPVTLRPDDSRDETKLQAASAETNFSIEEIPRLSVEQRIAKLDDAAREMASQISSHAFATINEAVDKVGNVVDAKGKPFSPEAVFEVLEKIQLDFDEDGKHKEITVVIPPALSDRARETLVQLHSDPKLSLRYQELIEKKREEWRAREAARKLVG
ncbi:MAG: hypothetical protein EG828_02345 [Deltaproteobacteria bacterium]|nr:hypothetical protein [Deltaproteobacteria bacterium]